MILNHFLASLGANVFVVSQFKWDLSNTECLANRRRNPPLTIEEFAFLQTHLTRQMNIGAGAWVYPGSTCATAAPSMR